MFGGIEIIAVEPGTEIEHEGKKLTVTETNAVQIGKRMYMTEAHVVALKAQGKKEAAAMPLFGGKL
ncbi:hypothetical protein [Salipiger sp. PrR003]|uniref:hypothetical protein n=1 Tax=Salipiger sp. PrR003 TaxID=2706776 RepID=UPI0013DB81F3|nr:hypothetical protein [Salipiger sp. PrR003]NDV53854.1 hypothetical protein [Salipiger sp. PrR003]